MKIKYCSNSVGIDVDREIAQVTLISDEIQRLYGSTPDNFGILCGYGGCEVSFTEDRGYSTADVYFEQDMSEPDFNALMDAFVRKIHCILRYEENNK